MKVLDERPIWSMSGEEKLATIDRLAVELARLETYRLHLIAALDQDGYAAEIGAHDTAQLIEFRHRLDRAQARRDVRLAQALAKYPAVSTALPATGPPLAPDDDPSEATGATDDGTAQVALRPAQAEVIVSALERVPTTVSLEDLAVAERELVGLARHLSPSELRRAGQRVRDVLDTDGPEPEEHKAYAREALTLTTADRGVKFRGYLANENAELLRAIIHAGARPHKTIDGELDPRPRDKRQADALTSALTIAATSLDGGLSTTPTSRASKPSSRNQSITSSSTTDAADSPANQVGTSPASATDSSLAGPDGGTLDRDTSSSPARADGGTPDRVDSASSGREVCGAVGNDVPGFGAKATITVTIDLQDLRSAAADAIGDTVYGDGLSAATIRRLACDARIIPLVLGSHSEPLDVGRSERLVTKALRRALNAREKGCVVCGAPPIRCDAHHLLSWIDGGATKISNLALLCRRHHIDLHAGDWTITIFNGTVHVARPTWADPLPAHAGHHPQLAPPRRPEPNNKPAPGRNMYPTGAANAAGCTTALPGLTNRSTSAASTSDSTIPSTSTNAAEGANPSSAAITTELTTRPILRGGGFVRRLLTAQGGDGETADADELRDAVARAIWGEAIPAPKHRRTHGATTDDAHAPDPWADPEATTMPAG